MNLRAKVHSARSRKRDTETDAAKLSGHERPHAKRVEATLRPSSSFSVSHSALIFNLPTPTADRIYPSALSELIVDAQIPWRAARANVERMAPPTLFDTSELARSRFSAVERVPASPRLPFCVEARFITYSGDAVVESRESASRVSQLNHKLGSKLSANSDHFSSS